MTPIETEHAIVDIRDTIELARSQIRKLLRISLQNNKNLEVAYDTLESADQEMRRCLDNTLVNINKDYPKEYFPK